MPGPLPNYLNPADFVDPVGQAVSWGEIIGGFGSLISIVLIHPVVKVVKAILPAWLHATIGTYGRIDDLIAVAYHSLGNVFATSAEPYARWLIVERGRVHPFITGTHAAIVTHEEKINNLHAAVNALTYGHPVAETKKAADTTAAQLRWQVAEAKNAAKAATVALHSFQSYVHGRYLTLIDQHIGRAQSQAEANAKAAAVTLVESQNEIFRRRLGVLAGEQGVSLPWEADTIPYALAGVISVLYPLVAEAESCYNPMCSDWRAAKSLLSELEGLVGIAVGATLVTEAIEHPITTGITIGREAASIGNNAVDIWKSLGLPT